MVGNPNAVKLASLKDDDYSNAMQRQPEGSLTGKRIIVGVGGGIAAFKAAHLVSQLRQEGAEVQVVLTNAGSKFVTPLTFEALSHKPVLQNLFEDEPLNHVHLAHNSDLFVIAPATYDLIGKLANGLADDYLTTTLSATQKPVLLCPAMEQQMYTHPIFQKNLKTLTQLNYETLEAEAGALASGRSGLGRLPEPEVILSKVQSMLTSGPLLGKKVLVTAGPTRERIDPMRVITNRSSGKMGYAMAEAAKSMGAQVTLISGPTLLDEPAGMTVIQTESVDDMFEQTTSLAAESDLIIMAAAVADWQPKEVFEHKEGKAGKDSLTLELVPTKDILFHVGQHRHKNQIIVGFAAETQEFVEKAKTKLKKKNADFFVANDVSKAAESDENAVVLIGKDGTEQAFGLMDKGELAHQILEAIVEKVV